MGQLNMDQYLRVEIIRATQNPQQAIYAAMHQDYSEGFVVDECDKWPDEKTSGELVTKHLLNGNRGHYGPLEHPQIILNCGWFPHSTMQQIRTHRLGISMDVQSGRYTGDRIIAVAEDRQDVEEVFYLRPLGEYSDRQGKKYYYDEVCRSFDKQDCIRAAQRYAYKVKELGLSEEHARDLIPFAIRQHWVLSCNVRSLLHILDLRWKEDAQLECQQLCDLIWPHFKNWVPAIAEWYAKNRAKKARLAP